MSERATKIIVDCVREGRINPELIRTIESLAVSSTNHVVEKLTLHKIASDTLQNHQLKVLLQVVRLLFNKKGTTERIESFYTFVVQGCCSSDLETKQVSIEFIKELLSDDFVFCQKMLSCYFLNSSKDMFQALQCLVELQPKNFFIVVSEYLNKAATNYPVLEMLTFMMQYQIPHIRQMASTPLLAAIISTCLSCDDTQVMTQGILLLSMLIPEISGSVKPHLSDLFAICFKGVRASLAETQEPKEGFAGTDSGITELRFRTKVFVRILYSVFPASFLHKVRSESSLEKGIHGFIQDALAKMPFRQGLMASPESEIESESWRGINLAKLYEECSSDGAPDTLIEPKANQRRTSFKSTLGKSIIEEELLPSPKPSTLGSNPSNQVSSFDSQYSSFLKQSLLFSENALQESNIPQLNEPDPEFLQSIISVQQTIEKEFIKLPNSEIQDPGTYSFLASNRLSKNVSSLQRDILILRNELLYLRFFQRHQNEFIRELHKKSIQHVESQSQLDNLLSKLQIQHTKIKSLQSSIDSTRQEFKEYKDRQAKWETELQLKISKLTSDRQMLSEHNIIMSEEYELTRRELEICKHKLNEKANANIQLQARLDEAIARIPPSAQIEDRSLQMLQQIQVLSNLLQNVQRSEEEWKGKYNIAIALQIKLKASLDKQTLALGDIPRLQAEIASLEKDIAYRDTQVTEARQLVEKAHFMCETKIRVTEEKYRVIRELNRKLEDQLSKVMVELSEKKYQLASLRTSPTETQSKMI